MGNEVILQVSNAVATLTLNRPEKMNAFTDGMLVDLIAALGECQDRDDVRVIVITGAGRGFCAGGDMGRMKEKAAKSPVEVKRSLWELTQGLPKKMQDVDKPVIAAINGAAVGGGLDVALMCDIRVASTSARFAETYAKLGLFPGAGGAYFLPRAVGTSRALKMLWTGEFLDAETACRIGLVDEVFPESEFMDRTIELAETIASTAPLSLQFIKRALYQGLDTDLRSHLDQASSHMALIRTSEDHIEAVEAHKEKRRPSFRGR